MFGFLKPKRQAKPSHRTFADELTLLIDSNPDKFVETIEGLSSGERLMIVVARNAVEPVAFAAMSIAQKEKADFTLAQFAVQLEQRSAALAGENEVMSRRMWWMMFGALILHFDRSRVPAEIGGRLWAALLSAISIAPTALSNNAIWSDEEKLPFQEKGRTSSMRTIGAVYMPKRYRSTAAISALEAEYDIMI